MRRFSMPWDRSLRISTFFFVALLLAVGGGVAATAIALPADDGLGPPIASLPLAVLLVVIVLTWALAPIAITVGAGAVTLERRLRSIRIPLSEVQSVALLGATPLRGAIRTWGAGGAFGYYGRFWSKTLGPFRLFATRSERLVLLDTPGARFLLSPEPPEPFVEAVLAQAHGAVRSDLPAPVAGSAASALRPVLIAVGIAALALGAIVGGSWAFAPRSIRAEGGAVVIERNLASTVLLPLGPGVEVRWVCGDELGRVWRTGGVALGRWRYGRWRSSKLGPFRLYSQRWGSLALIDGLGERVMVTPDDPVAFAREVGIGR